MSATWFVLNVLAPIGAVDVIGYHLLRFRLFERPESRGEQLTHLLRQASFLALAALIAGGARSPAAHAVVLALFAVDLANSLLDVAWEPASRRALGGVPRGELLLHFLGASGTGALFATYVLERSAGPLSPAPLWQAAPLLAGGSVLLVVEAWLTARAWLRPRRSAIA